MSDPLVSARMREIQSAAAARRKKREDAAAELEQRRAKEEAERRSSVSPRDVERAAAHKAACDFWTAFHERKSWKRITPRGVTQLLKWLGSKRSGAKTRRVRYVVVRF